MPGHVFEKGHIFIVLVVSEEFVEFVDHFFLATLEVLQVCGGMELHWTLELFTG